MTVPAPRDPSGASPEDDGLVARLFQRREQPVREFAEQAGEVAAACHQMALRFHQGGKLVVFGIGGPSTDAQHVAVEFVHPVIVGKRALPAIALTSDVATVTGHRRAVRDGGRSSPISCATWPSPPTSRSASPPTATAPACCPAC